MSDLETVKTFGSRMEAEVARSYLGSLGIKSEVYADDAGNMYSSLQLLRGVELRVNKKDLEKAKEFLKTMKEE